MTDLKKLLLLLSFLASSASAAVYRQQGADDYWYLSAHGKDLQGAAAWGRFLMEPSGPQAYRVKSWPDSEFRFETPDSFTEYKAGKIFKSFKLDQKISAALAAPGPSLISIAGIWKGQFKAMLIYTADVFVHLDERPGGKYSATMDIPKGKLQGQKLAWADFEHGVVGFDFLGGMYLGKLSDDGAKLVGSIYGGKAPYAFDLQRVDKGPE